MIPSQCMCEINCVSLISIAVLWYDFQAHRDRIKEQEIEKAEKQRLEEILNMCAEYEKQSQHGEKSKPPTPNR